MLQKIIKVGNSAALTIPQGFLKQAGWKVGDKVVVEGDTQMKLLLIKKNGVPYAIKITPEFKQWLDDFTKRNRALLQELARR